MSDQNKTPKPSLKDRVKPHLRTAIITIPIGIAIGLAIRKNPYIDVEDCLSYETMIDLLESGCATIYQGKEVFNLSNMDFDYDY